MTTIYDRQTGFIVGTQYIVYPLGTAVAEIYLENM